MGSTDADLPPTPLLRQSLPTLAVLATVLAANIAAGLLIGHSVAYTAVASTYAAAVDHCPAYAAPEVCLSVGHCVWDAGCTFSDTRRASACASSSTRLRCDNNAAGCAYDASLHRCYPRLGWTPAMLAAVASVMLLGGAVACGAWTVLSHAGATVKRGPGRFAVVAVVAVAAAVLLGAAEIAETATARSGLRVVGRFLAGAATNAAAIVSPMLCGEAALPMRAKAMAGVSLQVAAVATMAAAAGFGFVWLRAVDGALSAAGNRHRGVAFTAAPPLVAAALLAAVAIAARPPALQERSPPDLGEGCTDEPLLNDSPPEEGRSGTLPAALRAATPVALALSAAQQGTGISAVLNFAPALGQGVASPAVATLFVLCAFAAVSFVALPLASCVASRSLFLASSVACTALCGCLGLALLPTVCGVGWGQWPEGRLVLQAGVVAFFLVAYAVGLGPAYYPLAQSSFPLSRRGVSCGWTHTLGCLLAGAVNFGFPMVHSAAGGGDRGLGVCTAAFAVCGAVATAAVWRVVPKSLGGFEGVA